MFTNELDVLSWISNMGAYCNVCSNKLVLTKKGLYCSKCNSLTNEGNIKRVKIKKNKIEFRLIDGNWEKNTDNKFSRVNGLLKKYALVELYSNGQIDLSYTDSKLTYNPSILKDLANMIVNFIQELNQIDFRLPFTDEEFQNKIDIPIVNDILSVDNNPKTISITNAQFKSAISFNKRIPINLEQLREFYSTLFPYVNVEIPEGIRGAKMQYIELRYKRINKYIKMSNLMSVISDLVRKQIPDISIIETISKNFNLNEGDASFELRRWKEANTGEAQFGKARFIVEQPGIYIRINRYYDNTSKQTIFNYQIDGVSKLWELKRINKFIQASITIFINDGKMPITKKTIKMAGLEEETISREKSKTLSISSTKSSAKSSLSSKSSSLDSSIDSTESDGVGFKLEGFDDSASEKNQLAQKSSEQDVSTDAGSLAIALSSKENSVSPSTKLVDETDSMHIIAKELSSLSYYSENPPPNSFMNDRSWKLRMMDHLSNPPPMPMPDGTYLSWATQRISDKKDHKSGRFSLDDYPTIIFPHSQTKDKADKSGIVRENPSGLYARKCAIARQPVPYHINPEIHDELKSVFGKDVGISVDQRKKLAKKGKSDVNPYVMKYRNVYYTCPEFYCKRCERSYLANDILAAEGNTDFSENKYFSVYKPFVGRILDILSQKSDSIKDHLGRKKIIAAYCPYCIQNKSGKKTITNINLKKEPFLQPLEILGGRQYDEQTTEKGYNLISVNWKKRKYNSWRSNQRCYWKIISRCISQRYFDSIIFR